MMGDQRTERRVGVTTQVTASASRNLYAIVHSETWPDLLDVLERCCIEIETELINTDPADRIRVLEYHKLCKAAWVMFDRMQTKVIEAGNAYFSATSLQPDPPQMTEEEMERENILNPTFFPRVADAESAEP